MVAFSLNCPNCGAVSAAEASRCDYCGSALAAVSCPSCFSPMFLGTQFCPHCGVKAARELIDENSEFRCPGCAVQMQRVRVGATEMYECPACASTYLDGEVFTQLCTSREERGTVASLIGSALPQPPNHPQAPVRYVPCPACKKLMNRTNFGHRSGVVIDVCKADGVWLEHDELRRVLTFIDSGGLERARAMDRDEADAQRELARLLRERDASRPITAANGVRRVSTSREATSLLDEALQLLFS